MAGGVWLSQNKVRPGAYLNFNSVPKSAMTVGDRGIVAIGLTLDWGKENELIEVLSSDLLDGTSRKLVGFTAFDEESKLLSGALSYAYKALVYRMNTGGDKASVEVGGVKATARYSGEFGNKILIAIVKDSATSLFDVVTYIAGEVVDTQRISAVGELEPNDYVEFAAGSGDLEAAAGSALTGGTNGNAVETTAYPAMFKLLQMARWQVLACLSTETTVKANVNSFIKQMREDEGRYVQAVVSAYDAADYEGVINSVCGAVINEVEFSVQDFVSVVAGLTAGANFNQSNTARKISGASKIVGEKTDEEIKKGLAKGEFILSTATNGDIKVEQDINSLHTFTKEKDYIFSKNRVLRTLDEIGTTTVMTWENSYMGKVDNDDTGRGLFKSDLVSYGRELQRLRGIQEFNGVDDITVQQGSNLDSVVCSWYVKPVDSMEKLYMTVNVNS